MKTPKKDSERRGGGYLSAAAPRTGAKRRGGGDLAAAARLTDLVLFCILSAEFKGISGIFVPIRF